MVGAQAVKFIWFVKNNVVAGKRIVAVACGYVQFPLVNTEKLPEIMGFTGKMIVAAILVVMYGHNFSIWIVGVRKTLPYSITCPPPAEKIALICF